ncbi:MAG: Rad2 nuclease [Chrysothrix sp. TS-e1954]|nr:MAG: Rad2 nuclease [Chrysothrix sp. TS-e1954]
MPIAGFTEAPWLVPLNSPKASQLPSKTTMRLSRIPTRALTRYRHVDFAMHRVRMLQHFGITPYVVFDGGRLPSKAMTEQGRAERRRESKKIGLELLKAGKHAQAYQELQKAVEITPQVVGQMIEELKRLGVQYVVAPYEADAQLAYLEKKGVIEGIISEDSDLLVFGAKTLITKLDQYGDCVMIKRDHFTACREVNLTGWSNAEFRYMAILSGCDYLDNASRIGLKTAYRLVRKYKTIDRIMPGAQLDHKIRFPADYLESFVQADRTFLYQWVYDDQTQSLVHLTTPDSQTNLDGVTYIGEYVEPAIASQVSAGVLNATTKEKIVVPARVHHGHKTPTTARSLHTGSSKSESGKAIDTFFKPRRTPLAELSPNVFTPSPSQQELLQRQGSENSWVSEPAPSRPTVLQRGSTWTAGSRTVSGSFPSARSPGKRPRLCPDNPNEWTERSRFFSSTALEPSPLVRQSSQANKRRKGRKTDFNIWSDDSVEDAMLELSQVGAASSADNNADCEATAVPKPVSAEPTKEHVPSTPSGSRDNPTDGEARNPFSASLMSETKALRESSSIRKWSYADLERPSSTTTTITKRHETSQLAETTVNSQKAADLIPCPKPATDQTEQPDDPPSYRKEPTTTPIKALSVTTTTATTKHPPSRIPRPITTTKTPTTTPPPQSQSQPQAQPHSQLLLPVSPLRGSEESLLNRQIPESDAPSSASEFGSYIASSSPLMTPSRRVNDDSMTSVEQDMEAAEGDEAASPVKRLDFGRFAFAGSVV